MLRDIPQLDGTEDKVTKPKRFNGLNEFECQSNFLAASINMFRGLDSLWAVNSNHDLCLKAKCESGLRCLLCQFRSFALRVNRANMKQVM